MSFLGLDVGTTGCKAMVLSADAEVLALSQREYDPIRPHPGWAELDSAAVWMHVQDAIREVAAKISRDPIAALCVSSMGEAMTPVSRERTILGNCLLGFDARGADTTAKLAALDPVMFFERCGNPVSTLYGGQKLIWLRDNRPKLFESAYKFLSWADLLAYLLGGEPITDYSLANRTLFLDLRQNAWSSETLDYVGMPAEKLPDLAQAGTVIGTVSKAMAEALGLLSTVRIVLGAHDQCVSATGAGVIRPGLAAYGLGTYICITPTFATIPPAATMLASRLNVEHHALAGLYVSFYYNLTGGALLKWFRDTFAQLEKAQAQAKGVDVYDLLLAEMPVEPTDLMVLPHFAPTGPPYFDDQPMGLIAGLTLETSRGKFIKGLLEGVTFYFREGLERLAEAGIQIDEWRVTGGGARSNAWLQIKADILGQPLMRPKITEASALGAAILAGIGSGAYPSVQQAVAALVQVDRIFEPDRIGIGGMMNPSHGIGNSILFANRSKLTSTDGLMDRYTAVPEKYGRQQHIPEHSLSLPKEVTMSQLSTIFPNAGKTIRLGRILDPKTNRAAVIAFDHGLHLGPQPGVVNPGPVLEALAEAGADAFLVSPGIARAYVSIFSGRGAPGLIMRLDWTTRWREKGALGSDEGSGRLIASVEDAARLGADAVLVYMFFGYEEPEAEAMQAEQVTQVAQACERLGIGCIIEPMPRGLRVGDNPYRADYVSMGARIACEFGADVLKTDYTGSGETFKQVVEASFRPVLIAGGPKTSTLFETLKMVNGALAAGASGMFIGRNVFEAPDPALMMRVLRRMIHENLGISAALEALGS